MGISILAMISPHYYSASRNLAFHPVNIALRAEVTAPGALNTKHILDGHVLFLKRLRVMGTRGLRSWSDETHYSVLGVDYDASQKQIRDAYLKLSKQYHPDYNVGQNEKQDEAIHNKFVKINNAYSTLGNEKQRRMYDLEVLMQEDPRNQGRGEVRAQSVHAFGDRPMTFDERAQTMGFRPQDPNFYQKHGNYHKNVVMWCVAFVLVGGVIQAVAIMALYKRHTAQLDENDARNTEIIVQARANAMKYTTVRERLDNLNLQPVYARDENGRMIRRDRLEEMDSA